MCVHIRLCSSGLSCIYLLRHVCSSLVHHTLYYALASIVSCSNGLRVIGGERWQRGSALVHLVLCKAVLRGIGWYGTDQHIDIWNVFASWTSHVYVQVFIFPSVMSSCRSTTSRWSRTQSFSCHTAVGSCALACLILKACTVTRWVLASSIRVMNLSAYGVCLLVDSFSCTNITQQLFFVYSRHGLGS